MRIPWNRLGAFLIACAFASTVGLAPARAADQQAAKPDSTAIKAHLKKLDSGPKTIDVTKYPADERAAYKLFSKKCSDCHTLARPINSEFVLPSEWERYIKRMMYKPNSKMSEADGKTIYRFLVYDASVRKPELVKKDLSGLSPEDRVAASEKIKAINPAFTAP